MVDNLLTKQILKKRGNIYNDQTPENKTRALDNFQHTNVGRQYNDQTSDHSSSVLDNILIKKKSIDVMIIPLSCQC